MLGWFGWTSIGVISSLIFLQYPLPDWTKVFQKTAIGQGEDSIVPRASLSEQTWRDSMDRRRRWLNESTDTVRSL